jgi:hypothetical protein
MRPILILSLILTLLVIPSTSGASERGTAVSAERSAKNDRLAKRLATRFFVLLKTGNATGLARFLAPAFQIQRADGTWSNRRQYLRRPAAVESYRINRVVGTRSGNTLIARYWVVTAETINGQQFSKAPAPRLSTFQLTKRGWRLLSHANFNAPT